MNKTTNLNLRIKPEILESLKTIAKKQHRSTSGQIRRYIEAGMKGIAADELDVDRGGVVRHQSQVTEKCRRCVLGLN